MASVLAQGTGATRADVWLRVGDELHSAAWWPSEAASAGTAPMTGENLPALPDAEVAYPVRHQGELLGALTLSKPPSDPLSSIDQKLVSDLAGQAGLVLSNVRLTEDLRARLEDLKAAQVRIVRAQDDERRKLERNIHDGAQQQLVALTVKLRLLGQLAGRDAAKAEEMASQLQIETTEALENLRDLARGIYPPLLADQGLAAALESQARKAAVPTTIEPDGIGRYPQEVEATVYFSVLEALQNVAKYAEASAATVTLGEAEGRLQFSVTDDGRGFDTSSTRYGTGLQGIADRLEVVGGTLVVRSAAGKGTTVHGAVPLRSVEAEP
jgi:signal transduction histidine kinase